MTTGIIVWLFILTAFINTVSALTVYSNDKARYEENSYGRILESKAFRFFLKFDWKATQIFLRTFIANLLLLIGILIEILLFVLSLASSSEAFKTILSFGILALGLLIGVIITIVCRYKRK